MKKELVIQQKDNNEKQGPRASLELRNRFIFQTFGSYLSDEIVEHNSE